MSRPRTRAIPPVVAARQAPAATPLLARLRLVPLRPLDGTARVEVQGYLFSEAAQLPIEAIDITADVTLVIREREPVGMRCPNCAAPLADPPGDEVRDGESVEVDCLACGEAVEVDVAVPDPVFTVARRAGG